MENTLNLSKLQKKLLCQFELEPRKFIRYWDIQHEQSNRQANAQQNGEKTNDNRIAEEFDTKFMHNLARFKNFCQQQTNHIQEQKELKLASLSRQRADSELEGQMTNEERIRQFVESMDRKVEGQWQEVVGQNGRIRGKVESFQREVEGLRKGRKDQQLTIRSCRDTLNKLKAVREVVKRIDELKKEGLERDEPILAHTFVQLTKELPRKYAASAVFEEKIIKDRVQALKDIIFKNLVFQQQHDLQALDAACRSSISQSSLAKQLILPQINKFMKQNNRFDRPDLKKILVDQKQAESNFDLIPPRESCQMIKSLEKFGQMYRRSGISSSASFAMASQLDRQSIDQRSSNAEHGGRSAFFEGGPKLSRLGETFIDFRRPDNSSIRRSQGFVLRRNALMDAADSVPKGALSLEAYQALLGIDQEKINEQISDEIDLYPILTLLDTSNKIGQCSSEGDDFCKAEIILSQICNVIQTLFRELLDDEFDAEKIISCIEMAKYVEQQLAIAESPLLLKDGSVVKSMLKLIKETISERLLKRIQWKDVGIKQLVQAQRDCVLLGLYLEYLVVDGDGGEGAVVRLGGGDSSLQEGRSRDSGKAGSQKYAVRARDFVEEVADVVRDQGSKRLDHLITEAFTSSIASHLQNYNQVQINSEEEAQASDFGHNLELFINPWKDATNAKQSNHQNDINQQSLSALQLQTIQGLSQMPIVYPVKLSISEGLLLALQECDQYIQNIVDIQRYLEAQENVQTLYNISEQIYHTLVVRCINPSIEAYLEKVLRVEQDVAEPLSLPQKAVLLQNVAYLRLSLFPILNHFIFRHLPRSTSKTLAPFNPEAASSAESPFLRFHTSLKDSIQQHIDHTLVEIIKAKVQNSFDFSPKSDKNADDGASPDDSFSQEMTMFLSNTLFSLLNTQLDHRFIQHVLGVWTLRRLDELVLQMVFGAIGKQSQGAMGAEVAGTNLLKKELKQNLKQLVSPLTNLAAKTTGGKKEADPGAAASKSSGPPKSFNQIGIYNFLKEIEKIEKSIKTLMKQMLSQSESDHFNLWIGDLVKDQQSKPQKINELQYLPSTKSLCYLVLFPQKALGMFKLLGEGRQQDETRFIKQGSLHKSRDLGMSLTQFIQNDRDTQKVQRLSDAIQLVQNSSQNGWLLFIQNSLDLPPQVVSAVLTQKLQVSGDSVIWWAEVMKKKALEGDELGYRDEVVGVIDKNEMKEIQKLFKAIKK